MIKKYIKKIWNAWLVFISLFWLIAIVCFGGYKLVTKTYDYTLDLQAKHRYELEHKYIDYKNEMEKK